MKVKVKLLSLVRLFVTPRTVVYQVPQLMGFSRQEYWNGLPFPSPEDLIEAEDIKNRWQEYKKELYKDLSDPDTMTV